MYYGEFENRELRDRCSNWNKSRNSVYNPTSQEVKKETIYTRKQDLQISAYLIEGVDVLYDTKII